MDLQNPVQKNFLNTAKLFWRTEENVEISKHAIHQDQLNRENKRRQKESKV